MSIVLHDQIFQRLAQLLPSFDRVRHDATREILILSGAKLTERCFFLKKRNVLVLGFLRDSLRPGLRKRPLSYAGTTMGTTVIVDNTASQHQFGLRASLKTKMQTSKYRAFDMSSTFLQDFYDLERYKGNDYS